MKAFVAVTDRDWYEFLAVREELDEANFWYPHPWGGEFRVLHRGQPWFFKLRSRHGGWIVGGGFFERYTSLPLSLAWRAFGEKNGAPSLEAVRERIGKLRQEESPWWEDYEIGCVLLAEPFFLPEDRWIPEPSDWKKNIVRGKGYDLTSGTGEHLWRQVLDRLEGEASHLVEQDRDIEGGYTEAASGRRRIGQGIFRVSVTDAYGRQSAVTRERALPALDAAHIRPFSETEEHYVRNGLLLRSDIHRLFDSGYLTVTPEYRVEASGKLKDDFDDGRSYLELQGKKIWTPEEEALKPDPESLAWHNYNRFRG